jgi:hypothetical protein
VAGNILGCHIPSKLMVRCLEQPFLAKGMAAAGEMKKGEMQ